MLLIDTLTYLPIYEWDSMLIMSLLCKLGLWDAYFVKFML